jgi:CBS domain-containing protein
MACPAFEKRLPFRRKTRRRISRHLPALRFPLPLDRSLPVACRRHRYHPGDPSRMRARDIMDTRFHTLRPDQSIAEAVKTFHEASAVEQKKIFGLMVTDARNRLVGMLSMYDILLFVRPKHAGLWGEMEDLPLEAAFDELLDRVKTIRVSDIMTTDVVTVRPDAHVMVIADIMIKRHIRRLPVVDGKEIVGIVYISDLFNHLLKKFFYYSGK